MKSKEDVQKNIKLVTIDFDGTTLQKDQTWLSLRAMHAIKECQKKGIEFVPCTGRTQDMFPPQIENDESFRYWVTCAGSRVVDRKTGEILYKKVFSPEESSEVCKLFENKNIYCEIAAEGKLYFEDNVLSHLWDFPVPPHHVWYIEDKRQLGIIGKPSEYFTKENIGIEKVNMYGVAQDEAFKIYEKLEKMPYASYERKKPGAFGYDIQVINNHANRIDAVESILKKLNLSWENVMSIGDQMGFDSILIKHANLGVAMGNGDEELKKLADDVTDTSDNDGFAKAIEKWLL